MYCVLFLLNGFTLAYLECYNENIIVWVRLADFSTDA